MNKFKEHLLKIMNNCLVFETIKLDILSKSLNYVDLLEFTCALCLAIILVFSHLYVQFVTILNFHNFFQKSFPGCEK